MFQSKKKKEGKRKSSRKFKLMLLMLEEYPVYDMQLKQKAARSTQCHIYHTYVICVQHDGIYY